MGRGGLPEKVADQENLIISRKISKAGGQCGRRGLKENSRTGAGGGSGWAGLARPLTLP